MNSEITQEIYNKCKNSLSFAYWIGVAQTDGYFKKQFVKKTKRTRYSIVLQVGPKSIPMLDKFKYISQKLFNLKGCCFNYICKDGFLNFRYQLGCKNILEIFTKFNIDFKDINPPTWITEQNNLFGAYLAGVIDGDGDIRTSRPKYPQCFVRIHSGNKIDNFVSVIKNKLNCGVYEGKKGSIKKIKEREFFGVTYCTEFKVSSKNIDFFQKYVINHIALDYKKNKIKKYMRIKGGCRDFQSRKL